MTDSEIAPPVGIAVPSDPDAVCLRELGYEQELDRGLRIFGNFAMGFAAMSPVVGLYAVVLVGSIVAGPAWVWVLPIALAGQGLLLAVYAELASQYPIAGGAYQWSRRLMGGAYGWFSGWVAICAYAVANTTVAYLGAPWALTLLGVEPTPHAIVATGMALVVICSLVGALGISPGRGRRSPRSTRRSTKSGRRRSCSRSSPSPAWRTWPSPSRSASSRASRASSIAVEAAFDPQYRGRRQPRASSAT
jgi:Amino acid permease